MKCRVEIDTLDQVELTDAQARQLLDCGAVSEIKPASKKDKE